VLRNHGLLPLTEPDRLAPFPADSAVIERGGRRWDERLEAARRAGSRPALEPERWRIALDPYQSGAWERRMSWCGLGDAPETEGLRSAPGWVKQLEEMRNSLRSSSMSVSRVDNNVPFGDVLQPLVDRTWPSIADASEAACLTPSACTDLRRTLLDRLSDVAARPLGQLFSGSRTLSDIAVSRLKDGMPAGSSTEKYERFCRVQLESGLDELLTEFPVLGRLLVTVIAHWTETCLELLTRLKADRSTLQDTFAISGKARVSSLEYGLSDLHRKGRSVVIVTFDDGHRVVYKPRPVEIEARFNDLVATLGPLLPSGTLRYLLVLPQREYGYVEYVAPKVAADADAICRFYLNAGRILAILYLLGATDCHWENMIAADDQIILIDAETLFEGVPFPPAERLGKSRSTWSDGLEGSVLRTGMLPAWISVGRARSIDISVLGTSGAEDATTLRPAWCFVNTDDMVWGARENRSPQPACLPVSAGEANPLAAQSEELIAGFHEMLDVLRQSDVHDRVRAGLERFRGVRRRVVVRPTRTYALLQAEALDPEILRSPDERALKLELLSRAYTNCETCPRTWALLEYELSALEDLDIPYFEGEVGCASVLVGNNVVVRSYYEKEGLQEAINRLGRLSERESRWQGRLIRGAIAAHRFEMTAETDSHPKQLTPSDREEHRHIASDLVKMLKSEILEDPSGPPTWLTVMLLADATRVQLGLVPPGLYDGRAGIAAFLLDCDEDGLAEDVLRPVMEALHDHDKAYVFRYMRDVGLGMAGIGGILRLCHYRASSDDSNTVWAERSERIISALSRELLATEPASDLVSGIAGLVAPIAAIHMKTPTNASEQVLTTIGTLLQERQDENGGWALAPGYPALVGLSHGASGISVALGEISAALRNERFIATAAHGLEFERRYFDPVERNWSDLRKGIAPTNRLAMRSWCHGSVGVALARLRMLELAGTHHDAGGWTEQLSIAVESSISAPSTLVDHLCCGNIGRAAAITFVGQTVKNDHWVSSGLQIGAAVTSSTLGNVENYRLLLGIHGSSGLRLPGLMTGLAGIGMYLLHGQDMRWVRFLLL
jgi:type 2 lantibiotic biosynthesis protein LanM